MLQPGGRSSVTVGGVSRRSGWGGSVEERNSAMEFVSSGLEGAGVCNELGGGWSGRGRLDVETRLKREAMKGSGLGGV